ncbi:ATP-dependent RNA helicase DbpA [Sansalvadorimonas sp. 2012CJ34-2]|uniref:ATP-dependent RNA helicase DbpA n=1 Tax=Parendozoicomonas callyspongiae TaxID=2942213 RepID=A0ABT0PJ28_9GAMM|nr:ATP-dependent RNA helicase DbpA [Sansalvadorimonas sp. 2012CJ34-2]MCL6271266.1 ATP-dependent RNA helicase DbpA [Sansalvadorimonas sp. 2012CJ34-2]
MIDTRFSSLPLSGEMLANLDSLGYKSMTPVQAQSLPHVLKGKDLIARAKTGSGKTAAFGIGLLSRLNMRKYRVQTLVLCPTRELADQVGKELRRLARFTHNIKVLTLCGGMPFGPQIASLEHGAHIVVGTPGRIQEHVRKGKLKLNDISTLVLDEADRMLDMGFRDAIADLAEQTPSNRQTLLFSATYPEGIQEISRDFQRSPVKVEVESHHDDTVIEQKFFLTSRSGRREALVSLMHHYQPESSVVFCNTKAECDDVAADLRIHGFHAQAIHGDLDQRDRDRVLVQFANKSSSILVATDVAARGLDIKDLQAVINYEVTRDAEVHVHRIGRTGRAGKKGLALSLYTEKEQYKIEDIEAYQMRPVEYGDLAKLHDRPIEMEPPMVTLNIDGGKKNKVRPGDILGALTGDAGIPGKHVGKIDIFDFTAYVAIERCVANQALKRLQNGKIKGRQFRVRKFR